MQESLLGTFGAGTENGKASACLCRAVESEIELNTQPILAFQDLLSAGRVCKFGVSSRELQGTILLEPKWL